MEPITFAEVQPILPAPVPAPRVPQVQAWCQALSVLLTARYPQATDTHRPYLLVKVADAVARRLEKSPLMVQQNAGPFGARWHDKAALAAWFLPEELTEMDTVLAPGGTRTYRTPAPTGVWAGNPGLWEEDPDV